MTMWMDLEGLVLTEIGQMEKLLYVKWKKKKIEAWPVWVSGRSIVPCTEGSPCPFPVRAPARVLG